MRTPAAPCGDVGQNGALNTHHGVITKESGESGTTIAAGTLNHGSCPGRGCKTGSLIRGILFAQNEYTVTFSEKEGADV